jgi:hypothetical protein
MEPPRNSRMADEKTTIDQVREKPLWRTTQAVNAATTTSLLYRVQLSLWMAAGLVGLIFLIGLLVRIH